MLDTLPLMIDAIQNSEPLELDIEYNTNRYTATNDLQIPLG